MSNYLPCVEITTHSDADRAIIWLHGLGASGHDFESIVPELRIDPEIRLRFVFPHAPSKPITINNGYVMPAWFDILEPGRERAINAGQLLASVAEVHRLIDRELERGISSEHVMLAGFSQGGAVSLHAALTYDKPLAGLMGLSTWFPTASVIEVHPANAGLPIELYHGSEDPILPLSMARNTVTYLEALGFKAKFHTYPMQHTVCSDEVAQMARFMNAILGV